MPQQVEDRIREKNLVLYDGQCGFCQAWVWFIIDRDREEKFVFAPLQTSWARDLIGDELVSDLSSVVLVQDRRVFTSSTAALRIFISLGWPWKLMAIALLLPKKIRDFVYARIASNRHRLSNLMSSSCRLPSSAERRRFLD